MLVKIDISASIFGTLAGSEKLTKPKLRGESWGQKWLFQGVEPNARLELATPKLRISCSTN
jgi:hypothetical protein